MRIAGRLALVEEQIAQVEAERAAVVKSGETVSIADGAASTERIAHRWGLLGKIGEHRLGIVLRRRFFSASAGDGAGDFVTRLIQDHFIIGRLPWDHLFDDSVQPFSLASLLLLGRELLRPGSRVVDELGKQDGTVGRLAHHKCRVDGWPCRMDFSRADALLISSGGRDTLVSFLRWVVITILGYPG